MLIPHGYDYKNPPSYKSYKAEQFNKKMEKARSLKNSIAETSLTPEDKAKLLEKIIESLANEQHP